MILTSKIGLGWSVVGCCRPVGYCGSVAVSRSLWVGVGWLLLAGWLLWVGPYGLVAVGWWLRCGSVAVTRSLWPGRLLWVSCCAMGQFLWVGRCGLVIVDCGLLALIFCLKKHLRKKNFTARWALGPRLTYAHPLLAPGLHFPDSRRDDPRLSIYSMLVFKSRPEQIIYME